MKFAALALLLLAACGKAGHPIRIAVVGSFGDSVSLSMRLGAELGVAEVNAAGGVNGRPFELVIENDHGSTDTAVVIANRLVASDVIAVIGGTYSGVTLAAAPVYNDPRDPLLQISPSASAPDVSLAGPYTFRLCPSDLVYGAALAEWAHEQLHITRVAVLYLNDEYGRGVRRTFQERFTRLGGTIVQADPYLGNQPDVGPYLERLRKMGGADFLFVAGYQAEAIAILRQARALGLRLPILGGDGLDGVERAGAIADGSYVGAAYLPAIATTANHRFLQAFRRRYPNALEPNQAAVGAYDIVHMLRDAIVHVGTRRRALRDAIAQIGQGAPPFQGVTAAIAFDSLGDVPARHVQIGFVRDGRVLPAGAASATSAAGTR